MVTLPTDLDHSPLSLSLSVPLSPSLSLSLSLSPSLSLSLSLPLSPPSVSPSLQLQDENAQLKSTVSELRSKLHQCESDKLQLQTRQVCGRVLWAPHHHTCTQECQCVQCGRVCEWPPVGVRVCSMHSVAIAWPLPFNNKGPSLLCTKEFWVG